VIALVRKVLPAELQPHEDQRRRRCHRRLSNKVRQKLEECSHTPALRSTGSPLHRGTVPWFSWLEPMDRQSGFVRQPPTSPSGERHSFGGIKTLPRIEVQSPGMWDEENASTDMFWTRDRRRVCARSRHAADPWSKADRGLLDPQIVPICSGRRPGHSRTLQLW
jgi:hypothetical protein